MSIRLITTASVLAVLAGCAQTVENPAQSPSYVAAALGYDAYKQGDLLAAESQFESALSTEPDNPYALLGLGAVRENSGDYAAAQQLYTAARGTGANAPANYTYITEQRLERVANVDVAALAEENLARLSVRQASAIAPAPNDFASYDDSTTVVTQEVAYAAPVAPVPASFGTTESEYQNIGSYDSYIASIGGSGAGAVYAEPVDTMVYSEPTFDAVEPVTDIIPSSYESEPYYDAPLPYDGAAIAPQYEPLASIGPAYTSPVETILSGPSGPVLEYGQAFGDPVDLVEMPVMEKDATAMTQSDGLIFLGDG